MIDYLAENKPSHPLRIPRDLEWLAAYIDAEGSFLINKGNPRITATSIDRDLIHKVRDLLGGTIYGPKIYSPNQQPQYRYQVNSARAIGAMMTLYPLMSERRKWQIAVVLKDWKGRPPHAFYKKACSNGHPYVDGSFSTYTKVVNGKTRTYRVCRICTRARWHTKKKQSARSTAK